MNTLKKITLAFLLLFLNQELKAQISDVQQKGSYLYVYGENNKQLSYLSINNSDEFLGMGPSFYVVKKGSYIYTYDYNSRQISYLSINSSDKFKSAGGNTFNIQKGSYVYTYDKNCKQISYRSL